MQPHLYKISFSKEVLTYKVVDETPKTFTIASGEAGLGRVRKMEVDRPENDGYWYTDESAAYDHLVKWQQELITTRLELLARDRELLKRIRLAQFKATGRGPGKDLIPFWTWLQATVGLAQAHPAVTDCANTFNQQANAGKTMVNYGRATYGYDDQEAADLEICAKFAAVGVEVKPIGRRYSGPDQWYYHYHFILPSHVVI